MEANNMKAMRDALEMFCGYSATVLNTGMFNRVHLEALLNKAKAALAKPPRQCDVGTPDEQSERFENFCLKHIGCAEETGGRHCVGCPMEKASKNITQKCELYWAQMPYEEGGAK
jgi:hypothetical protein